MRVSLLIAEGRSLDVISQAESVSAYARGICTDFKAYTAANVICETADKLVVTEQERSVAQYRLVLGALNALSKHAHEAAAIGDSYVMRALAIAGWTPRLRACVVCGEPISADRPWFFSISAGGLMCLTDHIRESFDVFVECDLPVAGACRRRLGRAGRHGVASGNPDKWWKKVG